MDRSEYVVLFDGVSIPQEDVCTHIPTLSCKEDFYEEMQRVGCNEDDGFRDFLAREENVLKDGFRNWCENMFLNESDTFKDGSFNSSYNASTCTKMTCVKDLNANRSTRPDQMDTGEQRYDLSTNCSKTDCEEYFCRIDPAVFVLMDIDYIRAKCKWHFKNVTDFETNSKVIERIRYLDLFTQCFSLRMLKDNALEYSDEDSICYNFQNTSSNIEVLRADHKLNLRRTLDCIPEKDHTYNSERNITVNTVVIDQMGCTPNVSKVEQVNKVTNQDQCHLTKLLNNENDDFSNKVGFDMHKSGFKKIIPERNSNKSKTKKLGFSKDSINSAVRSEKKIKISGSSNMLKTNVANDNTDLMHDEMFSNIKIDKNFTDYEVNTCNTRNEFKRLRKFTMLNSDIGNCVENSVTQSVKKTTTECVKLLSQGNFNKNDEVSINSSYTPSDSSRHLGTGKNAHLKTIHHQNSNRYGSSTQSEPISCDSVYTVAVNQKQIKRYKESLVESIKQTKKKLLFESENGTKSETDMTIGDDDDSITTNILDKFIKNSKKIKIKSSAATLESLARTSSNTFVLDSLLQKDDEIETSSINQPIIIIGLKCTDQKLETESNECKVNVRRYIEGDNLCKPGRYALNFSKLAEGELEESNKELSFIYPQDETNNTTQGIKSEIKLTHYCQSTPESDIDSEESYAIDYNINNSDTPSIGSVKMYKKYRKKKGQTCRLCRKNGIIPAPYEYALNHSKSDAENLYVSCWKRFCIIL